ncbi:MAG TPA: ferritin-like domain-containing protein [Mobilitalea sp.]|nr:ferritin-like domain-containing protein [Mobilitalea sp.]
MNYNGNGSYGQYVYGQTPPTVYTTMISHQTDIFTYPQNLQHALDLIQQALSGETEDRMFYTWLLEQAPSKEDQEIITGIRNDEIGHFALFNQLYYEITGMSPQQITGEPFTPPENYCAGLARALLGEQNAVRKYRQILYAMQFRVHINIMTEIITDEIRHGILYNYLYSKNNCGAFQ